MSRTTPTVHQEGLYDDAALEWVAKLRRPEFSEADAAEFAEWLRADVRNAAAFDEAAALWELTLGLRDSVPSAESEAVIASKWRWSWVALAATVLLSIVGLPLMFGSETYQTLEGEQRLVELQDGSRIQLNTDTRLVADVSQGGDRRVTLARGEAYFDVATDKLHPFIVDSEDVRIEVLGTRFNIWRDGSDLQVDVESGRVKVIPTQNPAAEVVLSAGESGRASVAMVNTSPVTQNRLELWREGRVVYDDVALGDLVNDLDRYIPGTLALADASLADVRVSAVLRLSDGREMLDALTASLDLSWSEVQGGLKLISNRS